MDAGLAAGATRANNSFVTRIHEILFALALGCTGAFAVFAYAPKSVVSWLYRLDSSISASLTVGTSDLASNYFVFFILSTIVALCIAAFAFTFSDTRRTKKILLTVPGITATTALPALRFASRGFWLSGWPVRPALFLGETLFVVLFTFQYLRGKWCLPAWMNGVILAIHFALWSTELGPYDGIRWMLRFHDFRPFLLFVPAGAPVAWVMAFGSAMVWTVYVGRYRNE